ncbi:MAG: signal peptidase I [ANME-2 cluster archaeon]|nr:signal peptidase I [ANME-2 cluster archaeon]
MKSTPAELPKNTVKSDILILIIVVLLVLMIGFKLISLIVVVSDSMVPEFQRGDLILTQSMFLDVQENDIITFNVRNRNIAVTHRVIDLKGERIITMGDNNPFKDDYKTTQENVLFKAIILNDHPIVIKDVGALFITDYSVEGRISKYGDQFTFMQQLSKTIKSWGYLITIIALFGYVLSLKK